VRVENGRLQFLEPRLRARAHFLTSAQVRFGGIVGPGLYQLNVIIPRMASS
jgi:hypothetical protein